MHIYKRVYVLYIKINKYACYRTHLSHQCLFQHIYACIRECKCVVHQDIQLCMLQNPSIPPYKGTTVPFWAGYTYILHLWSCLDYIDFSILHYSLDILRRPIELLNGMASPCNTWEDWISESMVYYKTVSCVVKYNFILLIHRYTEETNNLYVISNQSLSTLMYIQRVFPTYHIILLQHNLPDPRRWSQNERWLIALWRDQWACLGNQVATNCAKNQLTTPLVAIMQSGLVGVPNQHENLSPKKGHLFINLLHLCINMSSLFCD